MHGAFSPQSNSNAAPAVNLQSRPTDINQIKHWIWTGPFCLSVAPPPAPVSARKRGQSLRQAEDLMPSVLPCCKAVVGMDTSIVGARGSSCGGGNCKSQSWMERRRWRESIGRLRSDRLAGFAADTSRQEQVPSDKSRRNRSCLRPRITSHQPESRDRLMRWLTLLCLWSAHMTGLPKARPRQ